MYIFYQANVGRDSQVRVAMNIAPVLFRQKSQNIWSKDIGGNDQNGFVPGGASSFWGKDLVQVETLGLGHLHIPAVVQVETVFGFDSLYGFRIFMNDYLECLLKPAGKVGQALVVLTRPIQAKNTFAQLGVIKIVHGPQASR